MDYAYHRLARSAPRYTWYRALLTGLVGGVIYIGLTVVFLIGLFIASVALPTVFGDFLTTLTTQKLNLADPLTFLFTIGSVALLLPAIVLARLILGPRPLGLLSSVAGRLRWRWLRSLILPALAIYAVVFALSFLVVGPLADGSTFAPKITGTTWLLLAFAILLTPLQATAEELVFRGYLGQAVGGWLKHPAWAILLPVPLFAIGHDYDLWGLADVALFAIVAGWLSYRTGGLEAAIVAHVINNTVLFGLGAFSLVDLNAKGGSPVAIVTTAAILAGYSALVLRQAKRVGLVTVRHIDDAPPADAPLDDSPLISDAAAPAALATAPEPSE